MTSNPPRTLERNCREKSQTFPQESSGCAPRNLALRTRPGLGLGAALGLLSCTAPGTPPPPPATWAEARNEVSLGIGATLFPGLPGHRPFPTPEGSGNLQAWGVGGEFAYRRRLAVTDLGNLWLGFALAQSTFQTRREFDVTLPGGEHVDDEVWASVDHATAGARWSVPVGPASVSLGGGLGVYTLLFYEEDDFALVFLEGHTVRTGFLSLLADDTAFGGYGSLAVDFPLTSNFGLRIEEQTHFTRFDHLDRFTPGNDTLSGPFHLLLLGFVGRF